jgi:hypothetical protein
MTTKAQLLMMNNYALLMEEAKERIGWLNILLSGTVNLPNIAIQEFGFLQLRILCELIALGCLTAHGDLPEVKGKALHEEWNATTILKRLQRLHPDFYPRPISVREIAPGQKELDDVTSGFLSKAELISLYGRSGDLLHRGSVSKLLIQKSPWPLDNSEITEWGHKIAKLLAHHAIGHHGGETYIICMMQNPDDFNRVQVMFADSRPEAHEQLSRSASRAEKTILPGLHPSKPWNSAS